MYVSKRKPASLPAIHYNNMLFRWVNSFKYLGVNIHKTNNLSKGLKFVCHQAKKAQSTLDMHISSHSTVFLNHSFELFDCLIKPVLTYGCAVWGSGKIVEIEKCIMQFMRQALNVKMTTNSCVVYAETGRFPFCVFINMYMIKHWLKILNMNVKQLVHVGYREINVVYIIESYKHFLNS